MTSTVADTDHDPHGRHARHPLAIGWAGWKDILFRVKERIGREYLGLIAAGVAFYGLLALFPGITALVAIAGLATEPSTLVPTVEPLLAVVPEAASTIILDQVTAVAGANEGGLGIAAVIGILLALYSASQGVANVISGLNIVYEEDEERGFVMLKLTTLTLTLFLLFVAIVALVIVAAVPALLAFLGDWPVWQTVAEIVRWPLLFLLGVGAFAVVYRYGPSRANARWRWLTPGSVAACLLWVIGSAAFAVYVTNFGSYNETFGALAGVIILLMWLWLSAFIGLIGALLDAELEAQTRRDTTTGRTMPLGSRGAVKADTVAGTEDAKNQGD